MFVVVLSVKLMKKDDGKYILQKIKKINTNMLKDLIYSTEEVLWDIIKEHTACPGNSVDVRAFIIVTVPVQPRFRRLNIIYIQTK